MDFINILKNIITDERYFNIIVPIYLVIMFLLVIYSRRCFWKLICRTANRTVAETYQKKKELIAKRTGSASRNDDSGFMSYLQELAPNQDAVFILYRIYGLSIIPFVATIAVFVLSSLNSNYKRIIPYFLVAIPVVSIAMLIGAKIGLKHEFQYTEKKDNRTPFYYPSMVLRIIVAIIACIAGIWLMVTGVKIYNKQVSQNDWIETTAIIYYEDIEAGKYVYYYSYNVDNQANFNKVESAGDAHNAGESISVKYNPEDPSQSTSVLKPQISAIVVNGLIGLLIIGMGMIIGFSDKIYNYRVEKAKIKYNN